MSAGAASPAPDPAWPRWSRDPFPPYRYVPGQSPHPRTDPRGHAYGRPEPRHAVLDPAGWASSPFYLRGIDLFNHAYWWESHVVFEALWHGAGRAGPGGDLFQALVQLAAAELKRVVGAGAPARALTERALPRLARVPSPWCGLDVRALEGDAAARLAGARARPLLLQLDAPPV